MSINLFETFAGVGSQHTALIRVLAEKVNLVGISEWDMYAVISYFVMNGNEFDDKFSEHLSDKEIREYFIDKPYSLDSKKLSNRIVSQPIEALRMLYQADKTLKNIPDINTLEGKDIIERKVNLLTYSFPCQDLSNAGYGRGMSKEDNTRSGLLWQIERVLEEVVKVDKRMLPKYLLMENVTAIVDKRHRKDYEIWKDKLEEFGYTNIDGALDARDFGIPQSRKRFFCMSIYDPQSEFETYDLNELLIPLRKKTKALNEFMKTDYRNPIYKKEADAAVPNHTRSRVEMFKRERVLSTCKEPVYGTAQVINRYKVIDGYSRTLTTKQDRWNNGGMHEYFEYKFTNEENKKDCSINPNGYSKFRFLTIREAFLLMGFEEEAINKILTLPSSPEKLYRQAGNSIVVDVLEAIFRRCILAEEEYNENR